MTVLELKSGHKRGMKFPIYTRITSVRLGSKPFKALSTLATIVAEFGDYSR